MSEEGTGDPGSHPSVITGSDSSCAVDQQSAGSMSECHSSAARLDCTSSLSDASELSGCTPGQHHAAAAAGLLSKPSTDVPQPVSSTVSKVSRSASCGCSLYGVNLLLLI